MKKELSGSDGEGTVEAVARACGLLKAFRHEEESPRLKDLAERTGLHPTTALRILRTLEAHQMVRRVERGRYRSNVKPARTSAYRVGYAAQSSEFAFAREVTASVRREAARQGVDLVEVNNRYSVRVALRNAERLIKEEVDVAIEFQTDARAAPAISARFAEARIPLITVEIPHPGSVYYGADNHRAGRIAGRALAEWARDHWEGRVDEIVLVELPMAGPLPHSRMVGALTGAYEVLPELRDRPVVHLDGNGRFGRTLEVMRRHFRWSRARRTLAATINDPSALAVARAAEEVGRADECVVVGQNASIEARAELRRGGSCLIGSVGYFAENYGDGVIRLALDLAEEKPTPPAVFVRHRLITPRNVDRWYPNDVLLFNGDRPIESATPPAGAEDD